MSVKPQSVCFMRNFVTLLVLASALAVSASATTARYWVRVSNVAGSVDSTGAVVTPWFERNAIKNRQLGGVVYSEGRWVVSGFGTNDF